MEKGPEELREAEVELPPHKRLIVDIGTHELPLPFFRNKEIQPEEVYLGIDIVLQRAKQSKRYAEIICSKTEQGGSACFMQADATRLPISKTVVDELLFGNVFGDPKISSNEKDLFIPEMTRVLKDEGVCVIKETNTPPWFKETVEFFKKNGFVIEKAAHYGDSDWESEIKKYQIPGAMDKDSFILYVRKGAEIKDEKKRAHWDRDWSGSFY